MPVVLITGCSNGLGLALAKLLASTGRFRLVVTARSTSLPKLKTLFTESETLMIRELDLQKPHNFKSLFNEISYRWGGVDLLVNNAAVIYRAVLEHVSISDEQMQIQTNYLGPRELIRLALPYMRHKKYGKIINISSVSGMMAMPTMSSYSASKWALEGMSEALWYELKPFNISVSLVQIGFVNSNSFKNTISPKDTIISDNELYEVYYTAMSGFVDKMMRATLATPEKISQTILKQIIDHRSPSLRIAGTLDAHFFGLMRRFLPQRIYHFILYYSLPSSIRIEIKKFMKMIDRLDK